MKVHTGKPREEGQVVGCYESRSAELRSGLRSRMSVSPTPLLFAVDSEHTADQIQPERQQWPCSASTNLPLGRCICLDCLMVVSQLLLSVQQGLVGHSAFYTTSSDSSPSLMSRLALSALPYERAIHFSHQFIFTIYLHVRGTYRSKDYRKMMLTYLLRKGTPTRQVVLNMWVMTPSEMNNPFT